MNYTILQIYTNEQARWHGKPFHQAVIDLIQQQHIAARCMVVRGIAGCYETGELATPNIEVLSYKMPLRIDILAPEAEAQRLLPALEEMVVDGILCRVSADVILHRTHKELIPAHLRVRDVMTSSPATVLPDTAVADVIRLLLSFDFHCMPVVDDDGRPVGMITQGDLIARADAPMRLGFWAALHDDERQAVLQGVSGKSAGEIMSKPCLTVAEDQYLSQAIQFMLKNKLKRLPVIDANGQITGMLARIDIFRAITHHAPQMNKLSVSSVHAGQRVCEIMRYDTQTVSPETSIDEIITLIDANEVQRVAVVDNKGKLLGLISDLDLLPFASPEHPGFWKRLGRVLQGDRSIAQHQLAAEIMRSDVITISEQAPVEQAIELMTQHKIKRLPVVGDKGIYKGMISRDALLRLIFMAAEQ